MGELREPLQQLAECGLPTALEAMGERWSFMILRAGFNGVHHFEEFLSALGTLSVAGIALDFTALLAETPPPVPKPAPSRHATTRLCWLAPPPNLEAQA